MDVTGRRPTRLFAASVVAMALLLTPASVGGFDEVGARPAAAPKSPTLLGSWRLVCENAEGMVIDIVRTGTNTALGRVKVLGKGQHFHYKLGDEILRLHGLAGGAYSGQLQWRNASGLSRWQPITMRLEGDRLHGTTANEHCYEYMERPR